MAIAYSVHYNNEYIASPPVPVYSSLAVGKVYKKRFTFTNGGLTAANDQIYLVKVPSICEIIMGESRFQFTAWTASTLIDIGWLAYREPDGDAVAENLAGLLNDLDVDAAGWWFDGTTHTSTGTIVHNVPVSEVYSVRAQQDVTIVATIRDITPLASAQLNGYITVTV